MSPYINARARRRAAVGKALSEGNTKLANEITANAMVGLSMLIMFIIMFLVLILNEIGVFTADKPIMRWGFFISAIVGAPIFILNQIYSGTKKWLKIPLMVSLVLVCAVLNATLGHNVTLAMAFPIVISTRYFDETYTKTVAIFALIMFVVACVFNGHYGIVNLNAIKLPGTEIIIGADETLREAILREGLLTRAEYTKLLFINDFLPRGLIFAALSVSCYFVSSRGRRMVEMQAETATKSARIETELNLATQIQISMLPCLQPAFPGHENIELKARYLPAKEVGGDFYDYFVIDKTNVGVVIADVSGKGVGAALFMTISKTVIKNQLQLGIAPSQALMNANKQLCESNEAGLFVTCWAGVYNTESGKLIFVNAGHNPPVLLRNGEKPQFINQKCGFVLAGFEGYEYEDEIIELKKGDEMFFYTDGVTEATNKSNQLYGNTRFLKCLEKVSGHELEEHIQILKDDIDEFIDGAEQFDDITVMAMKITE